MLPAGAGEGEGGGARGGAVGRGVLTGDARCQHQQAFFGSVRRERGRGRGVSTHKASHITPPTHIVHNMRMAYIPSRTHVPPMMSFVDTWDPTPIHRANTVAKTGSVHKMIEKSWAFTLDCTIVCTNQPPALVHTPKYTMFWRTTPVGSSRIERKCCGRWPANRAHSRHAQATNRALWGGGN